MSITFGSDQLCRWCDGQGEGRRGGKCGACHGSGLYQPPPTTHARTSDPATSHAAARSISSGSLRDSQAAVRDVLREGPATDGEIWRRLLARGGGRFRMSGSGARTRRAELVALGVVRDSGRTVRLPSGRSSIVWELVP